MNRCFWQRVFSRIDSFVSDSPTWLVIGKPSAFALHLLARFPHCSSMYDAMDDFPAFYAGFSRCALARRERAIAQRVDVLWASSPGLNARWERIRNDVRLVENALDLSVIVAASPAPLSSPTKVFGYVGTMAAWFDWDWVSALARARPDDEIRLIGPVFEPPTSTLPDNVVLLPACAHEAALQAMTEFDVGLIPFKRNALTASVDPIKYYEYRALALPVVSTDFGSMQGRSGAAGVFISHSIADIDSVVAAALQCERDPDVAQAFALQNSWEVRFDAAGLFSPAGSFT
ncbi:glycosyl transferase [Pseudomonas sp. PDNC002]|nr:glycosyl transferase [Pseudomonas sp. PDNC002]